MGEFISERQPETGSGVIRQLAESSVLLALAVLIARTFVVEGYLISTGSMAPCLLGYHQRVVCPHCQLQFARGTAFDRDSVSTLAIRSAEENPWVEPGPVLAHCPHCGHQGIDLQSVPRNEGDQLLVFKNAFDFRDPRRWEVIVFQSHDDELQPYCKRVVGLPGEAIQVLDGDVYANGTLQRKPYLVQRSLRVLVWDEDHRPGDVEAGRWQIAGQPTGWERNAAGFRFTPGAALAGSLKYQHQRHSGGSHATAAPLAVLPIGCEHLQNSTGKLRYDQQFGCLTVIGAVTTDEFRVWQKMSTDPAWLQALEQLYRESQVAPIDDLCGYNGEADVPVYPVHDLMLELQLVPGTAPNGRRSGRFEVALSDGGDLFTLVLNFAEERMELLANGDPVPLRQAPFPPCLREPEFTVELSTFDRQVVAAVAGTELFEPLLYPSRSSPRQPLISPASITAAEGEFEVRQLRLYRDVYYTPRGRYAASDAAPCQLGEDEFFVLGDNSPVSIDSRLWDVPAVRRTELIGKPLAVHLPSRQQEISWGGRRMTLRVPDFSRVRYIR